MVRSVLAPDGPLIVKRRREELQSRQRFRRPLHNGTSTTAGSINQMAWQFQSFRINDLEIVDQSNASWNQIVSWVSQIDALINAA